MNKHNKFNQKTKMKMKQFKYNLKTMMKKLKKCQLEIKINNVLKINQFNKKIKVIKKTTLIICYLNLDKEII